MTTATLNKPVAVRDGAFAISGQAFSDAVALVAKAGGRPTPHFKPSITLAFKDSRLTLSATDFEVTASIKLPVKGRKATTVSVDAGKLAQFAKALASEPSVEIVTGQEQVLIQAEGTVFHLPPVEGATITYPKAGKGQALDVAGFAKAVRIAGVAASTEAVKPVLASIYFDGKGNAAATDSYRLSTVNDAPVGLAGLIPATAARLAVAIFDAEEEVTFDITADTRYVVFRSGMKSLAARLVDGPFPAYTDLFRKSDAFKVLVSREQFADALDRVRLAAQAGVVPVRMAVTKGNMHLSVTPTDGPMAHDDVELTTGSKNVPVIGMNANLLAQMLKAVGHADNVQLGYADQYKPLNITDGSGDATWKMLIMPMKLLAEPVAPKPEAKASTSTGRHLAVVAKTDAPV